MSTSVRAASPAAAARGLPLKVPCWAMPLPISSIKAALPTEGSGRHATGDRLGEARQVGLHPEALDGTSRRDGGPAFHLVEDEDHAVAGAQLAHTLEVAGAGQHDADVHHDGLEDEAGDLGRPGREELFDRRQVVVRHRQRPGRHAGGDSLRRRHEGVGARPRRRAWSRLGVTENMTAS